MSDTPRTEDHIATYARQAGGIALCFARQLERELAQAKAERDAAKQLAYDEADLRGSMEKRVVAAIDELARVKSLLCETIEQRTALTAERDELKAKFFSHPAVLEMHQQREQFRHLKAQKHQLLIDLDNANKRIEKLTGQVDQLLAEKQ